MSTPPPPPPGSGGNPGFAVPAPSGGSSAPPPPPGPPPGYGAPPMPPGYQNYGQPATAAVGAPKNNGMAIASLVLSLVGIIPCFWVLQIPGLLGIIFGFVGKRQIDRSGGAQKGRGLATAGLIVGAVLVVVAIVFVVALIAGDGEFEFNVGE